VYRLHIFTAGEYKNFLRFTAMITLNVKKITDPFPYFIVKATGNHWREAKEPHVALEPQVAYPCPMTSQA